MSTSTPASAFGLDSLAASLDEASGSGHLPDPNLRIALDGSPNEANTKSYIFAIRSRLVDLGYLPDTKTNRTSAKIDQTLKTAIHAFQDDAGLKSDAWVGPRTWDALQALASFEEGQDPTTWGSALREPAVARAAYLRLYALGLLEQEEKLQPQTDFSLATNARFRAALAAFLDRAQALGLVANRPADTLNTAALRALFQQDEIARALGRVENAEFVNDAANRSFVEGVARIELWLLGFDVNIGKSKKLKRTLRSRTAKKVPRLAIALEEFWDQQSKTVRPKTKKARTSATPLFFQRLAAIEREADAVADDQAEDDLVDRVIGLGKESLRRLKNQLADLASSIWDGVKRVFRWVKLFIKKAKLKALNTLKNIARFIGKNARAAYRVVKKAIEIVHRSVVYFRGSLMPGSSPEHMAIAHDKDFDTRVWVNRAGDRRQIRQLLAKQREESAVFGAGCRILGHLLGIISQVARGLAGAVGWLLLLLGLTRLWKRIKAISAEVKQIERFKLKLKESPFVNQVA